MQIESVLDLISNGNNVEYEIIAKKNRFGLLWIVIFMAWKRQCNRWMPCIAKGPILMSILMQVQLCLRKIYKNHERKNSKLIFLSKPEY